MNDPMDVGPPLGPDGIFAVYEATKDWPDCANCGDVWGNAYFGAEHFCLKGGYKPKQEKP